MIISKRQNKFREVTKMVKLGSGSKKEIDGMATKHRPYINNHSTALIFV